jgi:tetratricopeptide (TPR) repeat protein
MVKEARQARVAGDMGRAIVKLEEALAQSPEDPSVHYELGLVHEQMGVYDIAAAHYEKVFQMGVSGAGALYEMAGAKLRDGFGPHRKEKNNYPEIHFAMIHDSQRLSFDSAWNPYQYGCSFILRG